MCRQTDLQQLWRRRFAATDPKGSAENDGHENAGHKIAGQKATY